MVGDLVRVGHDLGAVGQPGDEEAGVVPSRAPGRRDPARQRDQGLAIEGDPDLLRQLPDAPRRRPRDRRTAGRARRSASTAPPGNTCRPGPKAIVDGRRVSSTSGPRGPARMRTTVDAGRGSTAGSATRAAGPRRPSRPGQAPARSASSASGSLTGRRHAKSWHTNAVGRPSSANRPWSSGTADVVRRRRRGLDPERVVAAVDGRRRARGWPGRRARRRSRPPSTRRGRARARTATARTPVG